MTSLTTAAETSYPRIRQRDADQTELQLSQPINSKTATVDIVIPVYNEAHSLPRCIERLTSYLEANFPYVYNITIVDNGSTDETWQVAETLASQTSSKTHNQRQIVRALHLADKGRGRALKAAWTASQADILVYMDVDLSTDLSALEPLVTPLIQGQAALATGSRLRKDSRVRRSLKREFISRSYNYLLRGALGFKISDAQCGFKAIRRDAVQSLLPQVADNAWFFDTELLAKASRLGYTVHEVGVEWREDPDSRVKIMRTALDDLKGVKRLRAEFNDQPPRNRAEKFSLAAILLATGTLYIFGMLKNGYANSFYAAAVQAGTVSWKAFFFGSIDASNYITVDKPPFSLWLMELSTRLFGFHGWSMLLPNILAGLAVVYLVYAMVRRWYGVRSGLIAAVVMALTPIAVLMFGFNNPDALLVLLLTASMYTFLRSLEARHTLFWLTLTGIFTGSAFNTKMLQGLFLLPIFGLIYLVAAPHPFVKRLKYLLFAAIPTAIATLWWPVVVSLFPIADRPYIGSSTKNSIWDLITGYNGFGRLLGNSSGQAGPGRIGGSAAAGGTGFGGGGAGGRGPGGSGFGGSTGVLRMFNSDFGPNIAWFIIAALAGSALLIWLRRGYDRTDRLRTGVLAFAGWLLIHMALFSVVSGVIHPYYVLAMAPAVAALVGITLPILIRQYHRGTAMAFVLPLVIAATGMTALILLGYQASWLPWLRWVVLIGSLLTASGLVLHLVFPIKRAVRWLIILAIICCTAAPLSYSLVTAMVAHTGSIPTAGPNGTAIQGSNNESAAAESSFVSYLLKHRGSAKWIVAVGSANQSAAIQITSGQPVMAVGGFNGSDNALSVSQLKTLIANGQLRYYAVQASSGFGGMTGGFGGGAGNSDILTWVKAHAVAVNYGGSSYTLYDLRSVN